MVIKEHAMQHNRVTHYCVFEDLIHMEYLFQELIKSYVWTQDLLAVGEIQRIKTLFF